MRKKINHPHSIWVLALVSLGINLGVIFSAENILAEEELIKPITVENTVEKITTSPTPTMAVRYPSPTSNPVASGSNTETMKPVFYFGIKGGEEVAGDFKISGKVDLAKAVEFYLVRKGSINPKYYVGRGINSGGARWEGILHSKQFPNGEYLLFAKIKNVYGSYESDGVRLSIKNAIISPTPVPDGSATAETSSPTPTIVAENNSTANSSSGSTAQNNSSSNQNSSAGKSAAVSMEKIKQEEEEIKNDPTFSVEEKKNQLEQLEIKKREIKKEFVSRQEAERILAKENSQMTMEEKDKLAKIREQFKEDTDGDGVPDFEEERMGTDVFSADTDGDGYLDGDEVAAGFNPLVTSQGDKSDKIVFEEPKEKGEVNLVYEVEKVSFEKKMVGENDDKQEKEGIALQGKALPNSFVTLYVYSSGPIVVTVKADENGDWQYFLDKELEDGEHQVFATITDNTGKITAKSQAFSFVKKAQAVEKIDKQNSTEESLENNVSPVQSAQIKLAKFILIFSFISFFLAVASIGLFVRHRDFFQKKIEEMKNND